MRTPPSQPAVYELLLASTPSSPVLAQRTSDTANDDLADWVLFTQNALYAQQLEPCNPISEPRRTRPDGHVNPRRYN